MSRLELVATSAFGLEAVVARELADLGYTQQTVEDGRVKFIGGELAICRSNLWLRTADRVLVQVGQFPARDFGQLFDQTTALPWDQWLPVDATFPVSGKSVRSQLHNVPSLQSVVKKAIVENLKRKYTRHWFQESGVEYPIEVSVLRDIVTLTIDTSGPGLHKRGYRRLVGTAPLRETTAAALILLSYWKPDRPFWDPFCGSGTIAIEAAMIGRNRAPGLNRNFLCERWGQLTHDHWKQARDEARDMQRGKPSVQLVASDIDPEAIKLAQQHAQEASVLGDIQFREMDVLELKAARDYGVIICNPPYGERMGDAASAEAIYDDMADAFGPLSTWSIYVLTSHPDFERHFRRRADRRRKLYNGRIECTDFQFFGPPPPYVEDGKTNEQKPNAKEEEESA
jgi:putative N6-adenine-specific DNA methylase